MPDEGMLPAAQIVAEIDGRVHNGPIPAGRPGNSTYPEVLGLEKRMKAVEKKLDVIIARTEKNHGSSMKDQLDKICEKLGIVVPPPSDSQRLPDDAGK